MTRHIEVYHGKRVKSCNFDCNCCDENVGSNDELIKSSKQTQSQTDLILKCGECIVEGSTEKELHWQAEVMKHKAKEKETVESMDIGTSVQIQEGNFLKCSLCDEKFQTRRSLLLQDFVSLRMLVQPQQTI